MTGTEDLHGSKTIERWVANISDEATPADWVQGRLDVVAGFLDYINRQPDDLAEYFYLRK